MSYYTEKTLSSIRSLVDEWSIRKEGGKQSFFVLKEIDKLLADTPIDDVVSNKDVADKKNEVTMLRLERDEQLIRQQLDRAKQKSELTDASTLREANALREANETIHNAKTYIACLEAELSNCKSAIGMKNGVINDYVEHLELMYNQLRGFQDDMYEKNKTIDELTEQRDSEYETAKALRRVIDEIEQDVTKYKTTIDELNETIGDLRMAASDMLDTINECSRREAEDSRVLMQVVEIVKKDDLCLAIINQLADLLVDYLDAPEGPVVTLKTPSMGTRVVSKNEEAHIIDEAKMKAVRMLVGSDMWVLHTGEAAVEDKQQKETIDELTETIKGLRSRMAGARIIIDNQATSIEGLTKDLGARNTVIKDFKAIETKETDRLHKTIEEKNTVLQAYRDENTEVWSKLEKIEKIAEHPAYDCFSTALDEIIKIIQEE